MKNIELENERIMINMECTEDQKKALNNINNIISKYNDEKIVLISKIPDYIIKYTFDMNEDDKLYIMKNNRLIKLI